MADRESDQVKVKAKRPFEGVEGYKDERSAPFSVDRRRAAELKASGLVDELKDGGAKQAPTAENKMAEPPTNKAQPPLRDGKRV